MSLECKVTTSMAKMVTVDNLKKSYQDLVAENVHSPGCFCAACLFNYYKHNHGGKTRINKDHFFLWWLKEISGLNWKETLNLYYKISGRIDEKAHFEKAYPDRPEQYRIKSRYDRKITSYPEKIDGIHRLIMLKDEEDGLLPDLGMKIWPLLKEARKILKEDIWSVAQKESGYFLAGLKKDLIKAFYRIPLAARIFIFIKDSKKREINYTKILRKFKIKRDLLLILLSYLEDNKLITLDNKKKRAKLDPTWENSALFFFDKIDRIYSSFIPFFLSKEAFMAKPDRKRRAIIKSELARTLQV
jgi:hypothetical protein